MGVVLRKIYLLPIIIFLGFPLTFLVTYIIAMKSKDIVPFMPYVSDTGTYSPESCIFGQMLNTGAILMATTMYVRFRHVNEVLKLHHLPESLRKANKIGLWLGITATAGVGLVGNFQETNVFSVHLLGAALAFGLGTVYQVIQTLISLRMFPKIGSTYVNYARIVISLSCCVSSTITLVFGGLSLLAFDVIITAYLRYVHVNEVVKSNNSNRLFAYLNLAAFCDCVLAAIGFTLAGNFLISQSFLFHAVGLGGGLLLSSAYAVVQAVLCFFLKPNLGPMWMTLARMIVSGVCLIFCIIALGAGAASYSAQEGEDLTKWSPDGPGYMGHVICAMAEFGTLILLLVFALSFAYDFKDVKFSAPEIEIEELPQQPAPT